MKITLNISNEAHQALKAAAELPWAETARRLADGSWSLSLDGETYERLKGKQLEGESLSDCIVRLCLTAGKGLN